MTPLLHCSDRRGAVKKEFPMRFPSPLKPETGLPTEFGPFGSLIDYGVDAAQRTALFWEVMRQRGNQYQTHAAKVAPHVLSYMPCLLYTSPSPRDRG